MEAPTSRRVRVRVVQMRRGPNHVLGEARAPKLIVIEEATLDRVERIAAGVHVEVLDPLAEETRLACLGDTTHHPAHTGVVAEPEVVAIRDRQLVAPNKSLDNKEEVKTGTRQQQCVDLMTTYRHDVAGERPVRLAAVQLARSGAGLTGGHGQISAAVAGRVAARRRRSGSDGAGVGGRKKRRGDQR